MKMRLNNLEESIDKVGENIVDVALISVRVVDKVVKRRKFLGDKYIVVLEDLKEKQTFRRRVNPAEYLDLKVGQIYTLKVPVLEAFDSEGNYLGNVFRRSNLFFG